MLACPEHPHNILFKSFGWRWIPSLASLFPVLSTAAISNTMSFTVAQWNSLQPDITEAKVLAGIKE